MDIQYFSLTTLNTTNEILPKLEFSINMSKSPIEDMDASYYIVPVKYYINNTKIPIYVPHLSSVWDQVESYTTNYDTTEKTDLDTNLVFCLSYATVQGGDITSHLINIPWIAQNSRLTKPDGMPPQSIIVNNPYYHCYSSIHLLRIINHAINQYIGETLDPFSPSPTYFEFIKTGESKYCLLMDQKWATDNIFDFSIEMSPALADMFGFDYREPLYFKNYKRLNIDWDFAQEYNQQYLFAEMFRPTNTIFGFVKLVMTTNIKVESLNLLINMPSNTTFNKTPSTFSDVLTDYDLNIDDPDLFYNNINYTALTFDRKIKLINNQIGSIIVRAIVITKEGYECEIPVPVNGYNNLYFALIEG